MKAPMTPRGVEDRLFQYFATVRARAGRIFTVRDFNHLVMMNAYTPEDRACLDHALRSLMRAGFMKMASPTEYYLTPEGVSEVWSRRLAEA